MKSSSFDRTILLILAVLGLLLTMVIVAGNQVGMKAPVLLPGNGEVGIYGPVGLVFEDLPQEQELGAQWIRMAAENGAPVAGRLAWEGSTAWFWPDRPLDPGKGYTLRLEAGLRSESGLRLREAQSWRVMARAPEIVYLAGVDAPEVWRSPASGEGAMQLTDTGGKVYDFGVSRSGRRVAYSVENEQGGLDLWEVERSGDGSRLLLPCAADRCAVPLYLLDERTLLYTRAQAAGDGTLEGPGIWELNLVTLQTDRLVGDLSISSQGMVLSPDGKKLAFYDDGPVGGIRVVDLVERSGNLIPANGGSPGSWSPDGQELWFTNTELAGEVAVANLFAYELDAQALRAVAGLDPHPGRYGPPAWSPDGEWVAFAAGDAVGGAGSRLWRMHPDGSGSQVLAGELYYSYGAYSWDPTGQMLVLQRIELRGSLSKPQVVIWQAEGESLRLVAQDAALPRWLP